MNNLLFTRVKTLLIVTMSFKLSHCCSSQSSKSLWDVLKHETVDYRWLASIFHVPYENAPDEHHKYQCLGAAIHPRIVLASALCTPSHIKDDLKIRFYHHYNGHINNNEINDTNYIERSVILMFNYSNYYADYANQHKSDINILILSKPIDLSTYASVMTNPVDNSLAKYYAPSWKSLTCIYISSKKNKNNDVSIGFQLVNSMFQPHCCAHYMYPVTVIHNYFTYANHNVSQQCADRLSEITCFKENKTICSNDYPGPLICPDSDTGKLYLYGLLVRHNNCVMEISDIRENGKWIEQLLDTNIVNILPMSD